ncbi:MAG TPA: LuxR C-terminal-related transcriptional regulator [Gaiellaceae bacterium]|jgi:ATP/maltotriose-dependent transcriptional regulator MalT
MGQTSTTASPALEHIIERPRLITRLEAAGNRRVTTLVAPAGYGKTVLARQWSELQSGPVAWCRTTRASGDISLLAVQLDDALASIAPELPRDPKMVASIASANPSAKPLGRAIVQTFAPLSRDALLVVDEWEAAGTDEAEELMSILIDGLDIRFLVTTRTRPAWFGPRMELYGDGLELTVDELAMTAAEAAEVLGRSEALAGRARLMQAADGWPAVLGLAAMCRDVDLTSSRLLSHTLYEFIAGELVERAASETQEAFMLLAVAGISEISAAQIALGTSTDAVLADAVNCGLTSVTGQKTLGLHPLLREFLVQRFAEADAEIRARVLTRCRNLVAGRLWDEALCAAETTQEPSFAEEAIEAALDDLLAAGRTRSLERWVAAGRAAGATGGVIDYAESELLLRAGEDAQAVALATQATRELEGDLAARAHLVAGAAANFISRFPLAKEHADAAEAMARSTKTRERALWLQFDCGGNLHLPGSRQRLDRFNHNAEPGTEQSLRIADAELTLAGHSDGDFRQALDDARGAISLARDGIDPWVHASTLSVFSQCLILAGYYEESLDHIDALRRLAETFGLESRLPGAERHRARALIGLRKFGQAARLLDRLERGTKGDDLYFQANLPLQRARLHASVGELERALSLLDPLPSRPAGPSSGGELVGWRALYHAAAGESKLARALAVEAAHRNDALQNKALAHVAEALIALDTGDAGTATERLGTVIDQGVWDPVVIAVRTAPRLAAFIAERTTQREWLQQVLTRSADHSLAGSLGLHVPRAASGSVSLTTREVEVHELLAQGLTNKEIAALLHISPSTATVHVKHIFEKLGVRSRAEAARALVDESEPRRGA